MDKADRLINGSFGYLRYVEMDDNGEILRLWIEFSDSNAGKVLRLKYGAHAQALQLSSKWTPLVRREGVIDIKSKIIKVRRKQFPVVPAHAMSIHKSQGGTYDQVVYEYSKSHDISLIYVAMSRAKTLEGLFLTNKKLDHQFYHCRTAKGRQNLRTEFQRLEQNQLVTVVDECTDFLEQSDCPTISYFNVQSLNAHSLDVLHDPILSQASLLAMSETWIQDVDSPIDIAGFRCIARNNNGRNRAGGVAIYESLTSGLTSTHEIPYDTTTTSYGDVCCARIEYKDKAQRLMYFYLITIYAIPGVTQTHIIQLMGFALMCFRRNTVSLATNYSNPSCFNPLLICGDFNYNVNCTKLQSYLKENYSVSLASPNLITTRNGTSIDGVFYRHESVEVIRYVSYFSTHIPLLVRSRACSKGPRPPSEKNNSPPRK